MLNKLSKIICASLLLIIVIYGTLLRLYNIHLVQNVDEPNIIKRAVMIADGQYHIKWYHWPAQSLMRINAVPIAITTKLQSIKNNTSYNAQKFYMRQPVVTRTIAHTTTVLFAIASMILVFFIGKKMQDKWAGLMAASFLAVSFLHIKHSRVATPDVPMTATVLAALLIGLYIINRNQNTKNIKSLYILYLLGGGIVGFAMATKYTGTFSILPLVTAVIHHYLFLVKKCDYWKSFKCLARQAIIPAIVGAIITHTIFNPFAIVDAKIILDQLLFEANPTRMGADWSGAGNSFWLNLQFYLKGLLVWNGTGITIIAYVTTLYSLWCVRRQDWYTTLFVSGYFLVIITGLSLLGLHWSRWAVPLTPLISILSAIGMRRFFAWTNHQLNKSVTRK